MNWYFPPLLPGQVETEVTQRDQFSNDDVDISETIIREAIQNSLDALADGETQVRVEIRWVDSGDGLTKQFCAELLDQQLPHARAAELELHSTDFDNPTALVIEDFGTKGLTGSVIEKDNDNFSDFWRRHGKSHKTGKSRGRWGLGKLVYSTSSDVGAFFGLTVRAGDQSPNLMGQTVLNLRTVGGVQYPPHGFFCELQDEDDILKALPIPIQDPEFVQRFASNFQIARTTEPGLSVVIPYPNKSFDKAKMIGVAIANYFYPIITQQLVLEIDGVAITAANIHELAEEYADGHVEEVDLLFNFIEGVHQLDSDNLLPLKASWSDDTRLDEDDFDEETLAKIRSTFSNGEIVGLRLPVTITRKDGTKLDSFFSAFIQRPDGIRRGRDLYVRGGLTLPGESKFRERRAFGAMIANDEAVCALLGDAENAAHTKWIGSAEKVRKNYRNPQKLIKVIKNSLLELYDLLAEVADEIDEDALKDFLWTPDTAPSSKQSRRPQPTTPSKPADIPPPKPRLFHIDKLRDGFTIAATPDSEAARFPVNIRIEAAYDVLRGNPFKKYSPHDFQFGDRKEIQMTMKKGTAQLLESRQNELILEVMSPKFRLRAKGFDTKRDVRVKLTKVE